MIGYRIAQADLETLIEQESPGWLQKAATRTETFRQKGRYEESSSIWSQVKPVYMKLQGDCKCAYCERKLESVDYGKSEQDVEHFRPKGAVRVWKIPKRLEDLGIKAAAVPNKGRGYYLLPYHPFNYAAACKPCNSALKKDYFPVADRHDLQIDSLGGLLKEKPYLIYPLGDFDEAPERLIRFHGVSPQAVARSGHRRARALVTIEFFKLDDVTKRKNLLRERATVILALHPQLEKVADVAANEPTRTKAQEVVDGYTSAKAPHTNCARSFAALFKENRRKAAEIFDAAVQFILSVS